MVDDDESEAGTRARPRRSRPFWRKGWFWVGVIVAEVAVVLVLSVVFERSATEVDLAGADTTAFCDRARSLREEGLQAAEGTEGGSVGDPTTFERERDAYVELAAIAPPALVADLERLAAIDDEIIETVREIGEQKASDPSYNGGLGELSAALERAAAEGRVAAARLNLVLQDQCGIDTSTGATTTAVGTVPEPDMRPTVPSTTPP